jgi:hypothetical protein
MRRLPLLCCLATGQLGGGNRAWSHNGDCRCSAAARKARGQDERLPFMAWTPRRIPSRNHSPGEARKNAGHGESTTELNLRGSACVARHRRFTSEQGRPHPRWLCRRKSSFGGQIRVPDKPFAARFALQKSLWLTLMFVTQDCHEKIPTPSTRNLQIVMPFFCLQVRE